LKSAIADQIQCGDLIDFKTPIKSLLHFEEGLVNQNRSGIPFAYQDYLELVDWTGRFIRDDKRGFIESQFPPILNRLNILPDRWQINTTQFEAVHASRFNRLKPNIDTG
jgi:hypothetical protein